MTHIQVRANLEWSPFIGVLHLVPSSNMASVSVAEWPGWGTEKIRAPGFIGERTVGWLSSLQ